MNSQRQLATFSQKIVYGLLNLSHITFIKVSVIEKQHIPDYDYGKYLENLVIVEISILPVVGEQGTNSVVYDFLHGNYSYDVLNE